jgi:hypothetical protein
LNIKDTELLLRIQKFFRGVGSIHYKKDVVNFNVRTFRELNDIIVPHFEKYSLNSQKQADFLLFKSILEIINKNLHNTMEGFLDILKLKINHNKGLNPELLDLLLSKDSKNIIYKEIEKITPPRAEIVIQKELNPY